MKKYQHFNILASVKRAPESARIVELASIFSSFTYNRPNSRISNNYQIPSDYMTSKLIAMFRALTISRIRNYSRLNIKFSYLFVIV